LVFRKKKNTTSNVDLLLERIKAIRDLIDMRSNLSPSELRDVLRSIAESVAGLSEIERDHLARKIDEMFDEKISIRRGWKEEKVRRIRSLLKEISVYPNKKDPMLRPKILRAKQLDMQIRMDDASIETMLQIRDIIVDTVRRGVEPSQAWASIIRITGVITGFVEELTSMKDEYEDMLADVSPDVSDLMATYGVKPKEEIAAAGETAEEKEIKELIEKYGSE